MSTPTSSKKRPRYLSEDSTYWSHHAKLFKQSGLTRINYCRQNNVNSDRFGYWLSKQKSASNTPMVAVKLKSASEPLLLTPEVLCTLNLRNGNVLKIQDMRVIAFILEGMN
jgi:hypothetical protein